MSAYLGYVVILHSGFCDADTLQCLVTVGIHR